MRFLNLDNAFPSVFIFSLKSVYIFFIRGFLNDHFFDQEILVSTLEFKPNLYVQRVTL